MREILIQELEKKLNTSLSESQKIFSESVNDVGVKYCIIDSLLPEKLALKVAESFPTTEKMRHMRSLRENKYTSKSFDLFDSILRDITFALQSDRIVELIGSITGIGGQTADPTLYAGGLSMMTKGCYLDPHIDNSHDALRQNYRTLNLLYYVTQNWKEEYGGSLELWDKKVRKKVTIQSKFNRLVLMETNPWSWHSVSKVKVSASRNCVSNYYFSKRSPTGHKYFNVTSYSARPEEWYKSVVFLTDNFMRKSIRFFFPFGIGKKDQYKSTISNEE